MSYTAAAGLIRGMGLKKKGKMLNDTCQACGLQTQHLQSLSCPHETRDQLLKVRKMNCTHVNSMNKRMLVVAPSVHRSLLAMRSGV